MNKPSWEARASDILMASSPDTGTISSMMPAAAGRFVYSAVLSLLLLNCHAAQCHKGGAPASTASSVISGMKSGCAPHQPGMGSAGTDTQRTRRSRLRPFPHTASLRHAGRCGRKLAGRTVQPWIGCGLNASCDFSGAPPSTRGCITPEESSGALPANAGAIGAPRAENIADMPHK